jgi:hypothetical protein
MKTLLVILFLIAILGFMVKPSVQSISKQLSQPQHTNLHGVNPVGIAGLK